MLLTKSTTFFIGQIAALLGLLMNGIFWVLDKIGIPNIGLSIILFTIVIYMALMPLTIKQQRFSKLSQKMQPELKKIQDKYKGKKDQDSMMKQNEEIQQVYRKYGVSASGSCVQLLIQMPILFALYQVIYRIPAYVTQVKAAFFPLVDNLIATKGSAEFLQKFSVASQFAGNFKNEKFTSGVTSYVQNTYIDVLNRISTSDWQTLAAKYPSLKADISSTTSLLNKYNNFLGLNMGDTPWYTIKAAYASSVDRRQADPGEQYLHRRPAAGFHGKTDADHERHYAAHVRLVLLHAPCRHGPLLDCRCGHPCDSAGCHQQEDRQGRH